VSTVLREEGFSVHVYAEAGGRHKLPHCHVRMGPMSDAVLVLPSLTPIHGDVPRAILARLRERLDEIVTAWEVLNG
jgi:hypothetical protein